MLQGAEDRQADDDDNQGAEDGKGLENRATDAQPLRDGIAKHQQGAGVAKRRGNGHQPAQHQAHTHQRRQQHTDLVHAGLTNAGAKPNGAPGAAIGRENPGEKVVGKLHQQRGGQHHHGDPHHLRGDKDREVQIAEQGRNQRRKYCEMAAQPGHHQPAAALYRLG